MDYDKIDYNVYDAQGNALYRINKSLCEKKNLSEEVIKKIQELHTKKNDVIQDMEDTSVEDRDWLHFCASRITNIEYALQSLWGFPRDEHYHKFWNIPHCTCAVIDNEDAYPFGPYYINLTCPVHGDD